MNYGGRRAASLDPVEGIMKIAIRLSQREELKALPIIYRHSPAMILPERMYVLNESTVTALRKAGVKFTEVSREADLPSEVSAGEKL
jgi:hypothetical protein